MGDKKDKSFCENECNLKSWIAKFNGTKAADEYCENVCNEVEKNGEKEKQ